MNYESELINVFTEKLSKKYGIDDINCLYRYFMLRFKVEYYFEKITDDNITQKLKDFLIKELNLPDELIYKNQKINKCYANQNSLSNIVDYFVFKTNTGTATNQYGIQVTNIELIEKEWQDIVSFIKKKTNAFIKKEYYEWYVKYNGLLYLNSLYNAKVRESEIIEGFYYPEYHNFFERTLEEKYEILVKSALLKNNDVNLIKEEDLEDYIVKNLNSIEDGLIYIDRQFAVEDGKIDILAKDKQGNYVVIELKVSINKEVIWQSIYYRQQIKRIKKVDNVRMIVLAPNYPNSILDVFKEIPDVELFEYDLTLEYDKIKSINIRRKENSGNNKKTFILSKR